MKLLIILSIEEHAKDVRKLLIKGGVPLYSETDIRGFSTEEHKLDISDWFAHSTVERFSKLFFTIQSEETIKSVLVAVKVYNQEHVDTANYPLHAYQLNVEASV